MIVAPPLTAFPHAVDEAYCRRLQQCCLVTEAQWRQEGTGGCATVLDGVGGVFGLAAYNGTLDAGAVT